MTTLRLSLPASPAPLLLLSLSLSLLLLTGCAAPARDGAPTATQLTHAATGQALARQRSDADRDAAQARVAVLLQQPLTDQGAMAVALLNHRGLQARLAMLDLAEADLAAAGRPANPRLGFSRLAGGGVVEIDRSLVFNLLGLLTLPLQRDAAQQRADAAQLQAASDAAATAWAARRAFFDAVAAQDLLRHALLVKDAADATTELAHRMQQAGNFSTLARLRQQAFDADASARLLRTQQQAAATRERLARALGLDAAQLAALQLPDHLPDLPDAPATQQQVGQAAIEQRLDLRLARQDAAATAQALGLVRATRFVNVLEAGVASKSERQNNASAPLQQGWQLVLELPLFDWGTARTAQAQALYMQSLQHTAQVALDGQSQVREAHAAYRNADALARHQRDAVLPLHQRIAAEQLLRYNGMLASVFELLADAREQVASVGAATEALRDYWLADTQLQAALAGVPPLQAAPGTPGGQETR